MVLVASQWFSVVLTGSRRFCGSRRFSIILIGSRMFSVVLICSRRFSMILCGTLP